MPDHRTRLLTAQLVLHGVCGLQNDSVDIRVQLETMSGGVNPSRVDCVGHSLGGGLATICGPWAAQVWPSSDVRCASPLLFGNPQFLPGCSSEEGAPADGSASNLKSRMTKLLFWIFGGVIEHSPTLPGETPWQACCSCACRVATFGSPKAGNVEVSFMQGACLCQP